MNRLEEIVKTLKTYIAEGVETALDYLEQILNPGSERYNDYIQIKSRYNSLQRELLLGVLDHATYDIARNNISKALLLLANDLTEKDLLSEGGAPAESEDKRGEILYNIPDVMQIEHEEKCVVRIAFDIAHLKNDWVESPDDMVKSIRVSEIMAVSLLNVDESDPPFAIRTLTETVQFVDKDDFTEWVFYVKPLKTGRFPLVLRVSVIEMINNKEYKKDIVLEEEITVQTEPADAPEAEGFKSAGTSVTLGNKPLPPEEAVSAATQASEVGKKGIQRVLGVLLAGAAIAAGSYFGVQFYQETQAWNEAAQGGSKGHFEEFLKKHPAGRHSDEARVVLDSLNAQTDSVPSTSSILEPPPMDTSSQSPFVDSTIKTLGNKSLPPDAQKKKTDKRKTPAAPAVPKNKPGTTVTPPQPDLPPPVKTAPLLRGNNFYFKIPRFAVVDEDQQYMDFKFYQFNQYREVLAVLGSQGEAATMQPGMVLVFVPEKGEPVFAELKYVSKTPQLKNRSDAYFTLDADELPRLANEKFKSVRLLKADRQLLKTNNFTKSGTKNLNRRASEALKQLEERK